MNFLSNLFSDISQGAQSIYSGVKSGLSSLGNYLGNQTASASMNFPTLPGISLDNSGRPIQNQTVAPNMSTPLGFGKGYDGGSAVLNSSGQVSSILKSSGNSTSVPIAIPTPIAPRASTAQIYSAPVDQFGRQSTAAQGQPYIDANGKLVTPNVGFGGVSGQGGSGTASISGATGSSGSAGGGGSAFTGTLGGVGGGGTPSISSGDEQTRKKEALLNSLPGTTPSATTNGGGLPGFSAAPGVQTGTLSAPPVSANIDIASLSKLKEQLSGLSNNPLALSSSDYQATVDNINTQFQAIKAKYDQSQPTPPNPVVDTEEQNQFIQANADPYGVKQAMDDFRASNTNLSALETQRVDVMKSIQALNAAYQPIIDDIKTNPNLPKQLAARRLSDLQTKQKEVLQGFLDQQTILTQQISDQNETVNRAFNIVTFSQGQADKAADRARQNLELMVSSGAIGGFNAADMVAYSKATGYGIKQLQKLQAVAKNPNIDSQVVGSAEAGYSILTIDKRTGAVTKTQKVIEGTGSGSGTTEGAAVNLFAPTAHKAIDSGASPEESVVAAAAIAKANGNTLTLKEQQALLDDAKKYKAKADATAAANAPQPTFSLDPFNNMNNALSSFLFGSNNNANTTTATLK